MKQIKIATFSKSGTGRNVVTGLLLAIAIVTNCVAFGQDQNGLKFKGGIGVVPVTGVAANGAVTLNIVRGVPPGGPWRIAALEAEVTSDGRIKVEGRGLLLASGNGIGTNAGQTVHATLFCGPAATATAHDSTGVALGRQYFAICPSARRLAQISELGDHFRRLTGSILSAEMGLAHRQSVSHHST